MLHRSVKHIQAFRNGILILQYLTQSFREAGHTTVLAHVKRFDGACTRKCEPSESRLEIAKGAAVNLISLNKVVHRPELFYNSVVFLVVVDSCWGHLIKHVFGSDQTDKLHLFLREEIS
mmetsp:Transcript_3776/g.12551  ORF Transcript_3776/g.12551 Transcript_3776/m.12551 type:complete len:119 (-) Transcript_3776:1828-2184(-)